MIKTTRKGGKDMQGTMFRLDPEIHKELRIMAIRAGISMSDALREAVNLWLKEQRRKGVKK